MRMGISRKTEMRLVENKTAVQISCSIVGTYLLLTTKLFFQQLTSLIVTIMSLFM